MNRYEHCKDTGLELAGQVCAHADDELSPCSACIRECTLALLTFERLHRTPLRAKLQEIVTDARDEGRADMRDSVDEKLIEEACVLLRETEGVE